MKFRHLAISAVLLTLTGLAWAAPDMRPHRQLHGSPGDTAAMEQAGMDGCNMSSMHGDMNMHGNMQRMHGGNHMGHMMSQGMKMGHDAGSGR